MNHGYNEQIFDVRYKFTWSAGQEERSSRGREYPITVGNEVKKFFDHHGLEFTVFSFEDLLKKKKWYFKPIKIYLNLWHSQIRQLTAPRSTNSSQDWGVRGAKFRPNLFMGDKGENPASPKNKII